MREHNLIKYFNQVVKILRKYDIDSQGFFEYIRAIIENEGIEIEKIWKEDQKSPERRYERCIIFELDGKTYLIDSIEQTLSEIDIGNMDKKIFIFNNEENEYPYYGG